MQGSSDALRKVASRDFHFEHPFEKSRFVRDFAVLALNGRLRRLGAEVRRRGEVPIQIQIQPAEAIQIQIHGRRRPPDPDLAIAWIVPARP